MFELSDTGVLSAAKIKVIGIGGAGGNAVNTMISYNLRGVDFIVANTDAQALGASASPIKIQLGAEVTKGLGAGSDPDIGRQAALETREQIREQLEGADMVFITAGLGGGTGTGGAPIAAEIARELGALTVAVVTKPFQFEGKRRNSQAEAGIAELRKMVDTLIIVPNQRLLSLGGRNISLLEAFKKADDILYHAVKGISDLIMVPGLINLDFADVKTIMAEMGMALMGTGTASGENRAVEAAQTGDLLAASGGQHHPGRPRRPSEHHRRAEHDPLRDPRGLFADPVGGARGCEHHLRHRRRRNDGRRDPDHRHRDRV